MDTILEKIRGAIKRSAWVALLWAACAVPVPAKAQEVPDSVYKATLAQAMRKVAENSYPSAIMYFKQCIAQAPEQAVPYYQLAVIYARLGDDNQAVYYARKAFELAPESLWYEEYLLSLAVKYQKMEAVQAVFERRFVRDDSILPDLLDAYAYTQAWDKALAALNGYEKKHGRSMQTTAYRKDIYLKSKDYKNALAQLKVLQKASPDNAQYAVERAAVLGATGRADESWKYLEGFLAGHPADGYVAYNLLPHYNETGDHDKMFSALQVVAADTTLDVKDRLKVLDMTATVASRQEKYGLAFEKALDLILNGTREPLAYAYASEYYYTRGDEQRGFELLRQAVHGGFKDQNAILRLLYTEAQAEDFQALYKDARLVLDSIGESAEIHYLYGFAAHSLGDDRTAIPAFERGKELARGGSVPLYLDICSILGSLYGDRGDFEKSVENFEMVLMIDPDNAPALNNYGYQLACRGLDLDRARAMLEKALKIMPDEAAFLDSYAWILYLQKEYREALSVIERSLELDEDPSAEVLEHYYEILLAVGDEDRAAKAKERYEAKKVLENEQVAGEMPGEDGK